MSEDLIHPTALIASKAVMGEGVRIGPFAVIGNCIIGPETVIHSHVVVADNVTIGARVEIFPGALIGKEPKGAGATARTPQFERFVEIGEECSIGPHAVVYYDVRIGSNTLLGDGASIREQCTIGSRCIISRYVSINYATHLGDGVKVMDGTHLTGNMRVGDGAFISALVVSLNDNVVRAGFGDHIAGPVVGEDAVVGGAATLMPGVTIGAGATVAAGSVVTKDVEDGKRVAGVPARRF